MAYVMSSVRTCLFELLPIFYFRYLGKMKAKVQMILKLYEELEAAGETATLTSQVAASPL